MTDTTQDHGSEGGDGVGVSMIHGDRGGHMHST